MRGSTIPSANFAASIIIVSVGLLLLVQGIGTAYNQHNLKENQALAEQRDTITLEKSTIAQAIGTLASAIPGVEVEYHQLSTGGTGVRLYVMDKYNEDPLSPEVEDRLETLKSILPLDQCNIELEIIR